MEKSPAEDLNWVKLKVERKEVLCTRRQLIENSDYFQAMFDSTSNFVESTQNEIIIKDLKHAPVASILKILWDREYLKSLDEDEILDVLHAAHVLQFLRIVDLCSLELILSFSPENCLKFWLWAEPFYLQKLMSSAKLYALLNFNRVKKTKYFSELDLEHFKNYLNNNNLQCDEEFQVVEVIGRWFYDHDGDSEALVELLKTVRFGNCTVGDLNEMLGCLDIGDNTEGENILECIISLKNYEDPESEDNDFILMCRGMMKSDKWRNSGFPFIFVHKPVVANSEEGCGIDVMYHYDKFKRKRKYRVLNQSTSKDFLNVFYVDVENQSLRPLMSIGRHVCTSLQGYKIIGYKNLIFILGGQADIRKGRWNETMYIYDVFTEKWRIKAVPFKRRHFECCVVGHYLYVINGTGPNRILQQNMYYFDIETEEWSQNIRMMCDSQQVICCVYRNKLCILDINSRDIYIYDPSNGSRQWRAFIIDLRGEDFTDYSKNLFAFSYNESVYIKEGDRIEGEKIFQLELSDKKNEFVLTKTFKLGGTPAEYLIEPIQVVITNGVFYGLCKYLDDKDRVKYSLQVIHLDLDSEEPNMNVVKMDSIFEDVNIFSTSCCVSLFGAFHRNLI